MAHVELGLWSPADFDGATYDRERDYERLGRSLREVRDAMLDGAEWSLPRLAERARCSPAAASARLRDLRKRKYGGYLIERRYAGSGVWLYRMVGK